MRCRSLKFRQIWGKAKHAEILRNAQGAEEAKYEDLDPPVEVGYPFSITQVDAGYLAWPLLPDLFPVSFPGVKTSRDQFLVDIDRDRLEERIAAYFSADVPNEEMARRWPCVMQEGGRYEARKTRDYLIRRGRTKDPIAKRGETKDSIVRYAYRPFDVRWLYWESETKLLDEKRNDYFPHVFEGNLWFSAAQRNRGPLFYSSQVSSSLADHHLFESNSAMFSLLLSGRSLDPLLPDEADRPNVSAWVLSRVAEMGAHAEDVASHLLAILHAPRYERENMGALRQDWPRIPLPATKKALLASAELGRRVASLLDTESPVDGVTCGKIDPRLRAIAGVLKVGGGALDPAQGHLGMTAGWGHAGQGGVCMPGRGKVEVRSQRRTEAGVWRDDAGCLLE